MKYSYPHYHGPMRSDGTWPHPIPCDQLVCADKVADGTYPIDEHPKIGNLRFIDEAAREARGDEFFQNQQAQKAVEYAAERGVTLGEFHYKWIDYNDQINKVEEVYRNNLCRYELRTWAWGGEMSDDIEICEQCRRVIETKAEPVYLVVGNDSFSHLFCSQVHGEQWREAQ